MRKKTLFVLVSVLLLGLLVGCVKQDAAPTKKEETPVAEPEPVSGPLKGITLSPKSFQATDFTGFFEKAKQTGKIVSWSGDWSELGLEKGGPKTVAELGKIYDFTPLIEAQFFSQANGKLLRPLDAPTKKAYKEKAIAFAEKHKPAYLGLGIEVNVLHEKSTADFDEFVSFFNEVYDSIKQKSPGTKIFAVFQLEKMKGLNGGLFGGENNPSKAQWFLLEQFPKTDLVAFTTYPSLVFKNPSEIPLDYYAEIKSHTAKPVAFTEIGWHSATSPTGWESNETKQAEFVAAFFSLTKGLGQEFSIWSFLYDQNTIEPFNSMGLYNSNGTAKIAWRQWVNSKQD